jgi:hypothetical protein
VQAFLADWSTQRDGPRQLFFGSVIAPPALGNLSRGEHNRQTEPTRAAQQDIAIGVFTCNPPYYQVHSTIERRRVVTLGDKAREVAIDSLLKLLLILTSELRNSRWFAT